MSMCQFVDESGDPGIPMVGTSSPYFILAMVELSDNNPIPEITVLRQRYRLLPDFEFQFYRTRKKLKDEFFSVIRESNFVVRTTILNKKQIPSFLRRKTGDDVIVELLVRLALRIPETIVVDNTLIIDNATTKVRRDIRLRLSQSYRITGRKRHFKKIIAQRSQSSDGLQLADMVAGAVKQYVTDESKRYYNQIADKVVDFWQL